jgi:hypothetical protein
MPAWMPRDVTTFTSAYAPQHPVNVRISDTCLLHARADCRELARNRPCESARLVGPGW